MLYFYFAGIVGDLEFSRSPRVSVAQGGSTVGFMDGSPLQCLAKLHEIIGDWPHEPGALFLIFRQEWCYSAFVKALGEYETPRTAGSGLCALARSLYRGESVAQNEGFT